MAEKIRTVRPEEFDDFIRFLERCFGHSTDHSRRSFPSLYRPAAKACECLHVLERNGVIVSHVGVFPIEVVVGGVRIPVGRIGGVATWPEHRGQGYMTRLLLHAIGLMREKGFLLSGLGGDRQRYNTLGWEASGLRYVLNFTRRSLERVGAEPVQMEERRPWKVVETVKRFQALQHCYTRRRSLAQLLRKQGLRAWISGDGYAIAINSEQSPVSVIELVSASGKEAGLISAIVQSAFATQASMALPAFDKERLARLMPYVSTWTASADWQYRVVDPAGLLAAFKPILDERASGLPDFETCIGIREHDRVSTVTIAVHNGSVEISPERSSGHCVELDLVEAARLLLGGPPTAGGEELPRGLHALLPVPVHMPPLDHA